MKKKVSKIQLTVIIIVCIIGNAMLILSMTNFLTESFFKGKYLLLYVLILGSIFTAYKVTVNYLNASQSKN
jgi:predicted neutral ceramidase superfamily lipid hydrolase